MCVIKLILMFNFFKFACDIKIFKEHVYRTPHYTEHPSVYMVKLRQASNTNMPYVYSSCICSERPLFIRTSKSGEGGHIISGVGLISWWD